jgi:hypothetical protein
LQAFLKGLGEAGFFDGPERDNRIPLARGEYDPLPAFAAEFVRRRVNVPWLPAAILRLLQRSNLDDLIVFVAGDPVKFGLRRASTDPAET